MMKRLTRRSEGTNHAYFPNCFEECNGMCAKCDHETDYCETLAAYEDTDLTPDQIREMDKLYLEKCEEVNRLKAELAAERQKHRWIPVEERLPDKSGAYIVTARDGDLAHVTFCKWQTRYKRWDLTGSRAYWKVIAWQPLPESYQPEKGGE